MEQLPTTTATDITGPAGAPAPGRPSLEWLARNPPSWTIDAARALLGGRPIDDIAAAERQLRAQLAPVPWEKDRLETWRSAMDERLRRLAVKIAPGMSVEQGQEWREIIVDALSDLPAMIALTAARKALHTPMQFLNQVEGVVRDLAEPMIDRRNLGLKRLADLRDEIERAVSGPPRLAAQDDVEPLTGREIRALGAAGRNIGLAKGWLTQQQIDEALGDEAEG